MRRPRVLVVGASGVVGNAAARRFVDDPGFDVVSVSRRLPDVPTRPGAGSTTLDLMDAQAVRDVVVEHGPFSHVVYAALFEKPGDLIGGWVDRQQIDTNRQMLANLLQALEAGRSDVEHVSLLQGTKAYGFHVQPVRVPAKESQPRVEHENFYWEQQDLLATTAARWGCAWTVFRPQFVVGGALGAPMNLVPVIGCYAALCVQLGRPFAYPGGRSYVAEAVDSRLLADALHWAAGADGARDQAFNITNGDVFEWRDLWPTLAEELGAPTGPDERLSLADWLPRQEHVWDDVVRRFGLRPLRLRDVVGQSHEYADNAFAHTADGTPLESRAAPVLLSTVKLRRAGFHGCTDTEETFTHWFRQLRAAGVLP